MRKLLLFAVIAVLSLTSISSARAQTVYNYNVSFTVNGAPLQGCGGYGYTITANIVTTVTASTGESIAFQTPPGPTSAFCPAWNPEFGFVGYTAASLGLPYQGFNGGNFSDGKAFPSVYFNGASAGNNMQGWAYQPGTNPNFPTADYFNAPNFEFGAWTGSAVIWYHSYLHCVRGGCIRQYAPLGGRGSISTTVTE